MPPDHSIVSQLLPKLRFPLVQVLIIELKTEESIGEDSAQIFQLIDIGAQLFQLIPQTNHVLSSAGGFFSRFTGLIRQRLKFTGPLTNCLLVHHDLCFELSDAPSQRFNVLFLMRFQNLELLVYQLLLLVHLPGFRLKTLRLIPPGSGYSFECADSGCHLASVTNAPRHRPSHRFTRLDLE